MWLKLFCVGCGYTLGETDCIINVAKTCNKCGSITHFVTHREGRELKLTRTLLHEGEGVRERRHFKSEAHHREEVLKLMRDNHYVDVDRCR